MKYTLGFSPCPNDTFIFDALVNGKIDTGNFNFEVIMEDVETLNRMALSEELDISKISYGVLSRILPLYKVLNAGSALGMGVGPLLVTSRPTTTGEINSSGPASMWMAAETRYRTMKFTTQTGRGSSCMAMNTCLSTTISMMLRSTQTIRLPGISAGIRATGGMWFDIITSIIAAIQTG